MSTSFGPGYDAIPKYPAPASTEASLQPIPETNDQSGGEPSPDQTTRKTGVAETFVKLLVIAAFAYAFYRMLRPPKKEDTSDN
jgi:hypothetical protein